MTSRISFACGILVICAACVVVGEDRFWIPTDTAGNHPNTARVEQALRSTTEMSLSDAPLEDALNYLEDHHHIEIWLDKRSLQDEGIASDQQVSLTISGISLESGLHLLLDSLRLTYVVEDEVLKITTRTKADEILSTHVYPVRDLVDIGDGTDDYQTLMSAIQQTTSGKWMEIDQEGGAIAPVENARSLVIRQTQKVHREIEGILSALRRSKQLQGVGAVSINSDTPVPVRLGEPAASRTSTPNRSSRATPAWQRPRVYSAD